jgi:hypothetical protein
MKNGLKIFSLPLMAVVIAIAGCSDDKTTTAPEPADSTATTRWAPDGYWLSELDATSSEDYAYYSFSLRDTVSVTDADAYDNSAWDIAFKRNYIKLNGGVSGAKGVVGIDLASMGSPDSIDFDAVTDTSGISQSDWLEDYYDLVVDEWYSYNPNTHQLSPTQYVYIIKDSDGKYIKLQVMGLSGGGQPPDMGTVTFRYVYASSDNDVSGAPDTASLNVGSGTGYFDFSSGQEVSPVNPSSSTEWDIAFTAYEIHLNSNLFGPGLVTAYPIYQELGDPTDFDIVTEAPTQSQGYFWDELGSVLTDWYIYTGPPNHQLLSKDHIYLIKAGDSVYKLQIYSYYKSEGGAPVSAWYTFKWLEL